MKEKMYSRFLEALSAAVKGETVSWAELTTQEWCQIFFYSRKQHMLPLIYQATYNCSAAEHERELFKKIGEQAKERVYRQVRRTDEFLRLYKKICDKGIHPLVVKGLICRSVYPNPDHRPSMDEDILIRHQDFKRTHQIMLDEGMELVDPELDIYEAYEVSYIKPGTEQYIELHKELFPEKSKVFGDFNRYFEGTHNRAITEEIQGVTVYTMDYTDHFFYLVCHAVKHFINSGCGVRQVCDIALYANRYGAKIDWRKVVRNCQELRIDKWVAAILEIGADYFGLDWEAAHCPNQWKGISHSTEILLDDMIAGGIYGSATKNRVHSSNITAKAMEDSKMGKKPQVSVLGTIFPPLEYMKEKQKYLKKFPFLLPIAWFGRIAKYGKEVSSEINDSPIESIKIGKERIKILKKFEIIG